MEDDEVAALLAAARATSEANAAPPAAPPASPARRPAMPGAGPWWHDAVRFAPWLLAGALVLLLGKATGFL